MTDHIPTVLVPFAIVAGLHIAIAVIFGGWLVLVTL
jgi:hypothetical protein